MAADAGLNREGLARPFRALAFVLRGMGLFAVATGLMDMVAGLQPLAGAGADIPEPAATDPVLNSQIKFFGAVWSGFGVALWWTTRDLRGRASMLRILLGTLFLGGIGRALSALRFGAGPPLLTAFTVVEIPGSIALWAWHRRLVRADKRNDSETKAARRGNEV